MELEVNPILDVDLEKQTRREVFETDDGIIRVRFVTPGVSESFNYHVTRALYLKEGLYLFFKLGDS